MTGRWITLFFFVLSISNPAPAQPNTRRQITKTPTSKHIAKKNSAAVKRSEALAAQNQISPNANGTVTTTVVGATGATPGTATSVNYVPATTASSLGASVPTTGLPGAAGRASGDQSPLLLGYTPTATPSPTPMLNSDTGMAMAAALAGILGMMFGGGNKNNQNQQNQAANVGTAGPAAMAPNSQPMPAQPAAPANDSGASASGAADAADTSESMENADVNGDSEKKPTFLTNYNGKKAQGRLGEEPPPEEKGSACKDSSRNSAEWQMPIRVDQMQMSMCPDIEKEGAELPLKFGVGDIAGTVIGSNGKQNIYPPKDGIIKKLNCEGENCFIAIEHESCPGKIGGTCTSIFSDIFVDAAMKAVLEKRMQDKKTIYASECIGSTEDWGAKGKKSPPSNFYAKYGMFPDTMEKCSIKPFVDFVGYDKFKGEEKALTNFKGDQLKTSCAVVSHARKTELDGCTNYRSIFPSMDKPKKKTTDGTK